MGEAVTEGGGGRSEREGDGNGGGRDAVVQHAGDDGHACACGAIGTLLSVEGGMRDSSNLPLTVKISEGLPPASQKPEWYWHRGTAVTVTRPRPGRAFNFEFDS